MKLSELIAAYGDDTVQFQNLDQSAARIDVKGGNTMVTFGTEQQISMKHDGMEKLGLVVWLDRDRVKQIVDDGKP